MQISSDILLILSSDVPTVRGKLSLITWSKVRGNKEQFALICVVTKAEKRNIIKIDAVYFPLNIRYNTKAFVPTNNELPRREYKWIKYVFGRHITNDASVFVYSVALWRVNGYFYPRYRSSYMTGERLFISTAVLLKQWNTA